MDFKAFDNSPFSVIVCTDLAVAYRNSAAKRVVSHVRIGESILRILPASSLDAELDTEKAVRTELKDAAQSGRVFYAFIYRGNTDHIVLVGIAAVTLKLCRGSAERIASALPAIFARAVLCGGDGRGFDMRVPGDILADALRETRNRPPYHDFGMNGTHDLCGTFLLAYERITKRFHVIGANIKKSVGGENFICRADVGEYIYFLFVISYLAAGFRGASAELSGGEFVTTEIVCGAGDGESRRVGVEEYFSLLKVGRFTTEMFMQCSRYFGMLVCEVDGQMLTARLSLPSALSYLFNSDDGAVQSALALLDECLKFI